MDYVSHVQTEIARLVEERTVLLARREREREHQQAEQNALVIRYSSLANRIRNEIFLPFRAAFEETIPPRKPEWKLRMSFFVEFSKNYPQDGIRVGVDDVFRLKLSGGSWRLSDEVPHSGNEDVVLCAEDDDVVSALKAWVAEIFIERLAIEYGLVEPREPGALAPRCGPCQSDRDNV